MSLAARARVDIAICFGMQQGRAGETHASISDVELIPYGDKVMQPIFDFDQTVTCSLISSSVACMVPSSRSTHPASRRKRHVTTRIGRVRG